MNFMTRYYHSAKYKSRLFVFIAFFFTGFWLLHSCKDSFSPIGSEILPSTDYISIYSTDTFKITSYTSYDPKISTEALKTTYVGSYYDPNFGTTTSGFVTQLRLEREWEEGEGEWEIDSVKLVLRVTSNYGTNDSYKYLRISEISDMLYNNEVYNFNKSVDTTGYGVSAVIPPLRSDTINNIEITLPNSFGKYLIRDTSMLFYTTDSKEKDFRDYFKGIYITIPAASATKPFLLGFDFTYDANMYDYQNYIIIYMSDSTNWRDTYRFLLDSRRENARFTKIEHNFNANMKDIINGQALDSLSYVQGLYGVYTTISIPGLEAIKNDPARVRSAVNKARLIAPLYFNNTDSTIAQSLLMRYVNAAGEKEIVPDYYIGSESSGYYYSEEIGSYVESSQYQSYFGGVLDTVKYVYNFNLSNFVQNYFKDTQNKLKPELEIFLPANRVQNTILKANDSKTPLKFELTLTDF